MGFNNEIQATRSNITEILSRMRENIYFVDRSFQRRLVWTDKQKVRLIETVLMEYPMPEIYLWEQVPDAKTGLQKFSIVDGQQRLSTLLAFASNEWALRKQSLNPENQDEPYAGKFWKDLDPGLRTAFFQYNINARRIPSNVSQDEIRKIFARLNETDRSLNPQEMRNATLNGEFLNLAAAIADSTEIKALDIFSANDIRRMGDVEFASQLLAYERKGITNESQESINELYDEFSDHYPDASSDKKKIMKSLSIIGEIFSNQEVQSFFSTQIYIYTLHCLLDVSPSVAPSIWADRLSSFVRAYREASKDEADGTPTDADLAEFKIGASSRTRSKSSRTQRLFGLKKWIEKNYP